MDPLGVTFEMFDAIGRFRTTDGNQPIDSASALTGTMNNDGPANDPLALAKRLAAAPEVRDCLARQWFRYLSGRAESDVDAPAIAAAVEAMKHSRERHPRVAGRLHANEKLSLPHAGRVKHAKTRAHP